LTINRRGSIEGAKTSETSKTPVTEEVAEEVLEPKEQAEEIAEITEITEITEIADKDKDLEDYFKDILIPSRDRLAVQIDDQIYQWLNNTQYGLNISKVELVEKALAHFLPEFFKPTSMK